MTVSSNNNIYKYQIIIFIILLIILYLLQYIILNKLVLNTSNINKIFIVLFIFFLIRTLIYPTNYDFKDSFDNSKIIVNKNIPKIIYRTGEYNYNELAKPIKYNIENIVSIYEIEVKYFSDEDRIIFIKEYYPQYINHYNILKPKAFKADLWRILYLYIYGGIYNDLTQIYIKSPYEIVTDNDELVLCTACYPDSENYIYNAFIACYPKHPFIKACIDNIILNIEQKNYGENMFDITGPRTIMKTFVSFFGYYPGIGIHEINGYKIKFFQEKCYHNENGLHSYIEDDNKVKLIQSRMDNHYKMLYKSMDEHYSILWNNKDVYLHP
jgi:mannosyltransferase OCH1-like enzyme